MTVSTTKPNARMKKFSEQIRECALAYPGTREDFPWGHSAFKVGKKVFVFMSVDGEGLGMGVKLKKSHFEALELPFTEPTHYGLGKHGWVSSSFKPSAAVPMGLLEQWIDESYRLIATKKLIKELDQAQGGLGDLQPKGTDASRRASGRPVARSPKGTARTTPRKKKK